jgi:hypothetical protein
LTGEANKLFFTHLAALALLLLLGRPAAAQESQSSDPSFDVRVPSPAYPRRHPAVLFDEGHFNVHTSAGTYDAFARLIANDGYRVVPIRSRLDRQTLGRAAVLIIANALGAADPEQPSAARPAFTEEECDAIQSWVRNGGSLLLVTDHEPAASAAESLVTRFGIGTSRNFALDRQNHFTQAGWPGNLVFTRESGLLAEHPIINGRGTTERVNRVITFGGQSLRGPSEAVPILRLGDSATTLFAFPARQAEFSAAGRAMMIAMRYGRGRIVVTGEAAMLSAQLLREANGTFPFGMNVPGFDNRQLALNVMHWLSGLTD